MSGTKYVGSLLSLKHGENVIQGIVEAIDPLNQTLTLLKPFKDGKPLDTSKIALNAKEISDLKVIKEASEFQTPKLVKAPKPPHNNSASRVSPVKAASSSSNCLLVGSRHSNHSSSTATSDSLHSHNSSSTSSNLNNHSKKKSGAGSLQGRMPRRSLTPDQPYNYGGVKKKTWEREQEMGVGMGQRKKSMPNKIRQTGEYDSEDDIFSVLYPSLVSQQSDGGGRGKGQQQRGSGTRRRAVSSQWSHKYYSHEFEDAYSFPYYGSQPGNGGGGGGGFEEKNSCLYAPIDEEQMAEDFDFEASNALFHKEQFTGRDERPKKQKNFRHDENLIQDESRVQSWVSSKQKTSPNSSLLASLPSRHKSGSPSGSSEETVKDFPSLSEERRRKVMTEALKTVPVEGMAWLLASRILSALLSLAPTDLARNHSSCDLVNQILNSVSVSPDPSKNLPLESVIAHGPIVILSSPARLSAETGRALTHLLSSILHGLSAITGGEEGAIFLFQPNTSSQKPAGARVVSESGELPSATKSGLVISLLHLTEAPTPPHSPASPPLAHWLQELSVSGTKLVAVESVSDWATHLGFTSSNLIYIFGTILPSWTQEKIISDDPKEKFPPTFALDLGLSTKLIGQMTLKATNESEGGGVMTNGGTESPAQLSERVAVSFLQNGSSFIRVH